jgi:hypothetical protein
MADISKCSNDKCPIKHTCYRWTVPADPLWQMYSRFEPYAENVFDGKDFIPTGTYACGYRIPMKDSK